MFKKYLFATAFLIATSPAWAVAALVQIDFSDLHAGEAVTTQYDEWFTLTVNSNGGFDVAMAFDSNNPTGGDTDLGVNLGNLLIISENNDNHNPDDEAAGGTFTFNFTSAITSFGITLIDIENPKDYFFTLWNEAGDSIKVYLCTLISHNYNFGDGSIIDIFFDTSDYDFDEVVKIDLSFSDSGAISSIGFDVTEVPEPTSMLLFGSLS